VARKAAEPGYERWRRGYRQYRSRRNSFQQEVMQALKDAFDAAAGETGDSLNLPNLSAHARLRRATLMRKFCMVLWSGGVAETVFRKYAEGADLGRSGEDALSLLRFKATQFRPRMNKLTAHLDLAGFFTLLLWPNGQKGPAGPFLLTAPEGPVDVAQPTRMDMWFYVFTGLVELAEAVIVEGNYGAGGGLRIELDHLEELGLSNRILFYDNNGELYRLDDDQRWPLERIGDGVAFAARQNAGERG
jgi:hypothetical protein